MRVRSVKISLGHFHKRLINTPPVRPEEARSAVSKGQFITDHSFIKTVLGKISITYIVVFSILSHTLCLSKNTEQNKSISQKIIPSDMVEALQKFSDTSPKDLKSVSVIGLIRSLELFEKIENRAKEYISAIIDQLDERDSDEYERAILKRIVMLDKHNGRKPCSSNVKELRHELKQLCHHCGDVCVEVCDGTFDDLSSWIEVMGQ